MAKSIVQLVMEFFISHPNKEFKPSTVDDWVTKQYHKEHGKNPKGVSTDIADLHNKGRLIRVSYGVYKYDPEHDHEGEFQDFSEAIKQAIFHRDGFKCVICGLGKQDGVEIAADHKKRGLKMAATLLETDRRSVPGITQ